MTDEKTIENHLDLNEPRWFAVYTRFKREKVVKRNLEEKGIEVFLPLQKVVRVYTSRKKTLELPLISCYLFVKITKKDYVSVLETDNVVNFIKFSKNILSIPEQEIDLLKRLVGSSYQLELENCDVLEMGDKVEVKSGALAGVAGTLLAKESKNNFLVELIHVGIKIRLNVSPSQLVKK